MTAADITAIIKKQPVGFACGLICLVLGALLYFRSDVIDQDQSDYDTKSAEAAKIIANVSASKNLAEQVKEIQAHTKDMESRLVQAGQLATNQQFFYKLEAENEVKLLDLRQNSIPKSNKTAYVAVPFTLSVQGSYKQIMAFLDRLENGPHFCHFSSATFNKVAGGDVAAQNTMTLTLNLELLGQP
jgi:Tfp pilus assembly protein PilO